MLSKKNKKNINPDLLLSLPTQPTPHKKLADITLVEEEGGFRVSTVGAPHVTGCATAREPGGGQEGGGGGGRTSRASACSFALDVKGALRAVPAEGRGEAGGGGGGGEEGAVGERAEEPTEIDGAFHVARIVSDAEFEGGIGPLNVEVALDKAKAAAEEERSTDAAIERARGEIARRVVEAVRSSVVEASSESPREAAAGGEDKEEEEKEEAKVRGEAA